MTTPAAAVSAVHAPLTGADRCDRCGAAARVRAVLSTGELMFCGHHGRRYAGRLRELGATLGTGP
jgi:hypothetical protein